MQTTLLKDTLVDAVIDSPFFGEVEVTGAFQPGTGDDEPAYFDLRSARTSLRADVLNDLDDADMDRAQSRLFDEAQAILDANAPVGER